MLLVPNGDFPITDDYFRRYIYHKKIMVRVLLLLLLTTTFCHSQVGIGTTNPDDASVLDIVSTDKGVLIPRLTELQKNNISTPPKGLLVYQTDGTEGFWYHDGSDWALIEQNGKSWSLNGNSGTNNTTDFIGTSDNQHFIMRTNNTERIRIDSNGNVGVGTSSNVARFYVNIGSTEATSYGIRNESASSSTIYGIYNRSTGNNVATKYGFYNYISGGSGLRYGIYNQVIMSNSPSNAIYGIRNNVNSNGLGIQYGLYNNLLYSNSLTADAYGEYTSMDYSAGNRYGAYRRLNSLASISGGVMYGDYNRLYGSGNDVAYGSYNAMEVTGTSDQFGTYNALSSTGTGTQYGTFNNITGDNNADKYGTYNNMTPANNNGELYAVYNTFNTSGNDDKFGVYNTFNNIQGSKDKYGIRNSFLNANSPGDLFGTYTQINNSGMGDTYGLYIDVSGDANDYAAYFSEGNVVSNPSGGDYDFTIGTVTRPNALFVDASTNVVKIGADLPSFADEGVTLGGTLIDYVASFYNGQNEGTAIAIGANAYIVEGDARLKVNTSIVPGYHLQSDLGFSTTSEAWDDVYADDFVNISDEREKENIEPLAYGIAELMNLTPVRYTLKKDPFKEPKLGLLAQEVLPQISEAVKTHDYKASKENPSEFTKVEMERYGMKYQYLIPVLIKAMQEQQAQIQELKEEIETLKEKG